MGSAQQSPRDTSSQGLPKMPSYKPPTPVLLQLGSPWLQSLSSLVRKRTLHATRVTHALGMAKASEVSHFNLQMPQLTNTCCCHGGPGTAPTTAKGRLWLMSSLARAGCTMASCPRIASTGQSGPSHFLAALINDSMDSLPPGNGSQLAVGLHIGVSGVQGVLPFTH